MEFLPAQIGPYRIEEELGRGRTIFVFHAYDTLYDRAVVLKVFPPYHQAAKQDVVREFISEGREGIRLRHPNIIETFDAGLADGYHYIAQALAEGGTLAKVMTAHPGQMLLAQSIDFLQPLAAALDYAHGQGLVHNGIAPVNILIAADGGPLLSNFDLVGRRQNERHQFLVDEDLERLAYLSPEQARGSKQTTAASDVYAVGVLTYRLLTGKMPYQPDNGLALLHAIGTEIPPLPSSHNSTLAESVDRVILQALDKHPSNRWPSANAFVQALDRASRDELPMTVLVPAGIQPVDGAEQDTATSIPGNTTSGQPFREDPSTAYDAPTQTTLYPIVVENSTKKAAKLTPLIGVPLHEALGEQVKRAGRSPKEKLAINLAGIVVGLVALALLLAAGAQLFGGGSSILTIIGRQADDFAESTPPEERLLGAEETLPTTDTLLKTDSENSFPDQVTVIEEAKVAELVPVPLIAYRGPREGYQVALPPNPKIVPEADGTRFIFADLPLTFTVYQFPWADNRVLNQKNLAAYLEEKLLQQPHSFEELQRIESDQSPAFNLDDMEFHWEALSADSPQRLRLRAVLVDGSLFVLMSQVPLADALQFQPLLDSVFSTFQPVESIPLAALAPTLTNAPIPTVPPTVAPTTVPSVLPPATSTTPPQPDPIELTVAPTEDLGDQVQLIVADENEQSAPVELAVDENAPSAPEAGPPLSGRIAYALWNPLTLGMDTYIYTIGIGLDPVPLANKRQPDFRFDGWLAFNGLGGGVENIVRTPLSGQSAVVISAHPEDSRPHWSPNGKTFVFDSTFMGDREQRIYFSKDINEKEEEQPVDLRPLMYDFFELFGRYPIFVTDNLVAYNGCNVWENGGSCGIYRVGTDGTVPQQTTAWPNDFPTDNLGSQILFMSERDSDPKVDNWDVYLVNADGSNLQRLTEHPAHDGLATASPDGQYIAFVTDREGPWAVYVMRSNGSDQRKLFFLNGEFGPGTQYWEYDWKQERLSWGN